jgi:hypothetical protein
VSERGQMRRRLREQRRVREGLLLDLGALVYELHRQGKRAPELLQQKAAELTVVDEEVRELQAALDPSEEPARETTEVEALAGDEPEEGALSEEPEQDGEREEEGELHQEDEPEEEGEPGDESEPRKEDELGEEHERGDTAELGLEELAEEDEQLEGGDQEDGEREYEDSYDAPLVDREEPRA